MHWHSPLNNPDKMASKSTNSNKQFMIGNGLLALGVFFIVCLFLYLAFRKKDNAAVRYPEVYNITLDSSMVPDSVLLYINDSLLVDMYVMENTRLQVHRFAEESMLSVSNAVTGLTTNINLPPENTYVSIEKRGEKYDVTLKPKK